MSFADLFKASVDSNNQLSNSEKLNYLKACAKGEAAKLISSVTITDYNYEIAWELLHERYENKRSIVQAHLQAIWSQCSLKSESSTGLRKLLETTNENLRALTELGQPVEHWDAILVHSLSEKMDPESRKQWQLDHPGTDLLTWKQLSKFLDTRSRALEIGGSKLSGQVNATQNPQRPDERIQSYSVSSPSCENCSEDHKLNSCPQFRAISVANRHQFVIGKRLCFNCLHPDHSSKDCQSKFSCRECKMKHHTLLHRTQKPSNPPQVGDNGRNTFQASGSSASQKDSNSKFTTGHLNTDSQNNTVLLSTVVVSIRNGSGKPIRMRALLDSGSQASFITANMAKALMLSTRNNQATITTLGSAQTQKTCGILSTTINDTVDVNLHLISKITNVIPSREIDISQMRHINHLNLADSSFNIPSKVDVLLGADVVEEILLENKIKDNGLYLRDSILGWVVSGPVATSDAHCITTHLAISSEADTDQLLSKFWELESFPEQKHLTVEERKCEEHYKATTQRNIEGRFVVQMPFKEESQKLGYSKANAMKRFLRLEQTLHRDESLLKKYSAFIQEFLDLGHLEKVEILELDVFPNYYLPHHCVLKEDSSTTKLRVVFDASSKTTTGVSLNECLLVGPKVQEDLFDILLRFRFFKVGMSADIAKMYRQVELSKKDKDYHRIFWRFDRQQPIDTYRMTRVTYGVANSSFHAIRSLVENSLILLKLKSQ